MANRKNNFFVLFIALLALSFSTTAQSVVNLSGVHYSITPDWVKQDTSYNLIFKIGIDNKKKIGIWLPMDGSSYLFDQKLFISIGYLYSSLNGIPLGAQLEFKYVKPNEKIDFIIRSNVSKAELLPEKFETFFSIDFLSDNRRSKNGKNRVIGVEYYKGNMVYFNSYSIKIDIPK